MKKLLYILLPLFLLSCSTDDDKTDDDNPIGGGGENTELNLEKAKSLIIGTWNLSSLKIDGIDTPVANSDHQETMTFDSKNVTLYTYDKDNKETSKNTYPYTFSEKSDIYRITITYNSDNNSVLLFDYLREKDMQTYTNDDNKIKTWKKK